MYFFSVELSRRLRSRRRANPPMETRGFLISWAMDATTSPRAASFSDWISRSWVFEELGVDLLQIRVKPRILDGQGGLVGEEVQEPDIRRR